MAFSDTLGMLLPTAGFALGGPTGGAIGSVLGGMVQSGAGARQMRESNRLDRQIPMDDPEQRGYLNRLARQERQYRAGTDPSTALANRLAQQSGAQTQANLARAGGPGLVQNLLSSQNVTNRGLAQSAAQAAANADNMLGMQGQLVNMMANRRYDRMRYRRDLALMQGQQNQQNANNLMSGALSLAAQGTGANFNGILGNRRTATPTMQTTGAPLRSAQNTALPQGNMIQPIMATPTAPMPYADPSNLTMQLLNPR